MDRLGQYWTNLRSSFWFVPALIVAASIGVPLALFEVDSSDDKSGWPAGRASFALARRARAISTMLRLISRRAARRALVRIQLEFLLDRADAQNLSWEIAFLVDNGAPLNHAVEGRFKATIFSGAGFRKPRSVQRVPQIDFTTRATIPVLMLNGRNKYERISKLDFGRAKLGGRISS